MVMATGDCQCQCQCLGMCLGQVTGSSHRSGVSGIKIGRALLELPDTDHDTDTDSWPVNTPTRGMPPPPHRPRAWSFSLLSASLFRVAVAPRLTGPLCLSFRHQNTRRQSSVPRVLPPPLTSLFFMLTPVSVKFLLWQASIFEKLN